MFGFLPPCLPASTSAEIGDVIALPDRPFVIPIHPLESPSSIEQPPVRDEWPHYRQNVARTGAQPYASSLSDPAKIRDLNIRWWYPPPGKPPIPGGFKASPIVVRDTVFIGGVYGHFFAIDAATGTLKWQYPPSGEAGLLGGKQPLSRGFEASASYWPIGPNGAVIFGA
jgi:hypothetical protein